MKIMQVSPYFYPHVGGVESHVFTLARSLRKRGHEIVVATSNYGGLPERKSVEGIEIIRIKPFTVFLNTPITPPIKGVVLSEKADVVHAHSPPPLCSFFAGKGCKEARIPFVLTYHCDPYLPVPFGRAMVEIYQRSFGSVTTRQASKIIVHTKTYAFTSRLVWKYDIAVIPSMVDLEKFTPEISGEEIRERYGLSDSKVVLFVGRLVVQKGIEYLIDAVHFLPDDAKLMIAGSGPLEKKLQKHARDRKLSNRIIFAGGVDNDILPKYYAACDVFALPSTTRLEGFGLAAVEAMASGKPVIVSDIPGVREVIEDGIEGSLAEPMNPLDLGEKLRRMLSNDKLRKEMGQNCRKKAEKFYDKEKITDLIENVYRSLVQ